MMAGIFTFGTMLIFLGILLISAIALSWPNNWFSRYFGLQRKTLLLLFASKLVVGLLLSWVYAEYYTDRSMADTYKYFDDAGCFFQVFQNSPYDFIKILFGSEEISEASRQFVSKTHNWYPVSRRTFYNDNRTIIRLNAIFSLFTGHSYLGNLLLFNWLAFVGQLFLFRTGRKYLPNRSVEWLMVCFLIPSVIFWSSSILKEAPLLLALGLLMHQFHQIKSHLANWTNYTFILLLVASLVYIKFYALIFMIPAILVYLQLHYIRTSRVKIFAFNVFGLMALAQIWHWIHPRWSIFTILKWKKNDFVGLARVMDANSFLKTYALEDNLWSFLLNIPQGLVNSLLRPFPWEITNAFSAIASLENILIVAAFVVLICRKKSWDNLSIATFIYAISFLTIIGMITPIAGSLVRYKIPVLPFLFFSGLTSLQPLGNFNRLRKIKVKIQYNFLLDLT